MTSSTFIELVPGWVQSLCSQPLHYAIIQINSDPTADFHNAVTYPSLSRSISANVWEGSAGGGSRSAILKLRGDVGGLVHERMKKRREAIIVQ